MKTKTLIFLLLACVGCASYAGAQKAAGETLFTPLPQNVKVIPPSVNLHPHVAAFSGIWQGVNESGLRTTLVVEDINPPNAAGIYSWGNIKDPRTGKVAPGGWIRLEGEIEPGRLKLSGKSFIATYDLLSDGTLKCVFQGKSSNVRTIMRKAD